MLLLVVVVLDSILSLVQSFLTLCCASLEEKCIVFEGFFEKEKESILFFCSLAIGEEVLVAKRRALVIDPTSSNT
jgi:hypothetical protein